MMGKTYLKLSMPSTNKFRVVDHFTRDNASNNDTDSVECIECLHHWLDSGIIAGVSMMIDFDGLVVIDD